MYICDKCGAHIDSEAKFCGQCGDPVTEADIPKQALSSSAIPLAVITFGYSSSANYPKAIRLCEHIPTYEVNGEDKHIEHKVTLAVTEISLIKNLFDLVGSWKSSQMLIAGKPCTKRDLTYFGLGCYQTRQQTSNPEQYCKESTPWHANIWGCLRMPNIQVDSWAYNHSAYGQLDDRGRWILNKDLLYQDLMGEIKAHELCPKLNREKIIEIYNELPDYIDPKEDERWEYVIQDQYFPETGKSKKVVKGIQPANDHVPIMLMLSEKYLQKSIPPKAPIATPTHSRTPKPTPTQPSSRKQKRESGKQQHIIVRILSAIVKTILVLFLIFLVIGLMTQ